MSFQREPRSDTKRSLNVLVLVTISLVALWAATGGLDTIVIP